MLITFRSTATESITMFGDTATPLLKMMGASGRVPGALAAQDVPGALQQLESGIEQLKAQTHAQSAAPPAMNEDWGANDNDPDQDDKDKEPPIAIATRAVPLISLLKRAAAANAEVMWEGK
ncbi:MAG TPA: DUF1840 domain-containing protein [Steroidobacteraceae bacterium]|jgi:hypothetical protein